MLLMSCTAHDDNTTYNTSVFSTREYTSLNTKEVSPYSRCVRYYKDAKDVEWLFYEHNLTNELIIFSLNDGEIKKRLKFERSGPDGIGSILGCFVHNIDSIFLCSTTYYRNIFLTDTTGQIKKKYKLNRINDKSKLEPHTNGFLTYDRMEALIEDDILGFFSYSMKYNSNNEKLSKENIFYRYDLKNEAVIEAVKYPELDISDKCDLTGYTSAFTKSGHMLISFWQDNNIYEYIPQVMKYIKHGCKSRYQKSSLTERNGNQYTMEESMANSITTCSYEQFVYDEYRNVYYRFFYPGIEINENDDIKYLRENPEVFSIMVLDDAFNVIGETMMPKNAYSYHMTYITEDGLFISLHPKHPKYDPDNLKFEKLILKRIDND